MSRSSVMRLLSYVYFLHFDLFLHCKRTHAGDHFWRHDPTERAPVPLVIHHTPFCFTFAFFPPYHPSQSRPISILDSSHLERRLSTGSISIALNVQREICVLQKLGGLSLAAEEVIKVVNIVVGQAKETEKLVEGALREDWEEEGGRRSKVIGNWILNWTSI